MEMCKIITHRFCCYFEINKSINRHIIKFVALLWPVATELRHITGDGC